MANNGRQGEQLFQQIMSCRNYKVNNVTRNPHYWYKDIDFIITSRASGLTKSFEVKWDTRVAATGNLYIETTSRFGDGRGWWEFCEADYLAYGDAVNEIFYIIPVEQLKQRIATANFDTASCGSDSTGYLVPLAAIADITQIL